MDINDENTRKLRVDLQNTDPMVGIVNKYKQGEITGKAFITMVDPTGTLYPRLESENEGDWYTRVMNEVDRKLCDVEFPDTISGNPA